ncbi:MAG: RpiB/LacA/LacB family sugar-phosphate isomerase [Clostridia bacterium]|nr:RpiB/LacA/LacB family sugar-phosphate isomerase [Clostridia bacterium]
MLINVAYAVINAKELLCQVDRDIGDGDHGIGMAGGFEEALKELQAKEYNDVYEVFFTVGRTLIRVMGGASGIIFGLLFYAGSRGMSPKAEINVEEFSDLFRKALVEIQGKGQAKPGDKTVIDALVPMVESLKESAAAKLSFKETLAKAYVAADVGVNSPDDETIYPLIAEKVVKEIINSNYEKQGILLCGTGIGMAITANKFPGIYAAVCHDAYAAERARLSNNVNVFCMGARIIGPELAKKVLKEWLNLEFKGGRSLPKVTKISEIERSNFKCAR